MPAQLQPFFNNQSRLLSEGRISALAQFYNLPLPVFLPRDSAWHLLQSRGAVVEAFWEKFCGIRGAGVGRLRACVNQEMVSHPARAQAQVVWFYVGEDGRRLGRTVAVYFMSRRPAGLKVDMMEFRRIAFPQLNDWFSRNAGRVTDTPPLS